MIIFRPCPLRGPLDRRSAIKEKHRESITSAALDLMEESHSIDINLDTLAKRADVSRRTIFNHFSSIDEVISEALCSAFDPIETKLVTELNKCTDQDGVFNAILAALQGQYMIPCLARATALFSTDTGEIKEARDLLIAQRVFNIMGSTILSLVFVHFKEADDFYAELIVSAFMSALLIITTRWANETQRQVNEESIKIWDTYLERLVNLHIYCANIAHRKSNQTNGDKHGRTAL